MYNMRSSVRGCKNTKSVTIPQNDGSCQRKSYADVTYCISVYTDPSSTSVCWILLRRTSFRSESSSAVNYVHCSVFETASNMAHYDIVDVDRPLLRERQNRTPIVLSITYTPRLRCHSRVGPPTDRPVDRGCRTR